MSFVENNKKNQSQMRKSVDDLLANSQDVIGNSLSQAYTALTTPIQQRSPSPARKNLLNSNNSPKSSPNNSPKPVRASSAAPAASTSSPASTSAVTKCSKSDTHLSPNYYYEKIELEETSKSGDQLNFQGQGDGLSLSRSQENIDKNDKYNRAGNNASGTSKLAERAKKKSWYSVLYPSYKSRTEDFKKLFKEVPDDERLVVDYSCAIQKDILVHGRLYVSQNYLCFYSNIIVWETRLSIKWKDVTAITKEKTARVIPNAILVCTQNEKHFLTSFTSRDSTYLLLFRVWQNALMDKPMNPQELWQSVHSCYGEQLGLTSDDEDYIDPYEDKLHSSPKQSADSVSEEQSVSESQGELTGSSSNMKDTTKEKTKSKRFSLSKLGSSKQKDDKLPPSPEQLPTDMSDSTDSEHETNIDFTNQAECTSMHEGRQLVHTILPINVDALFTLLFSNSKFLNEFHKMRKTTDFLPGEWVLTDDGVKQRIVTLTIAITQTIGPKSSQVTETQLLRECTTPGQLYSIDMSSVNAGIPYADSFYISVHFCLSRTNDDHTVFSVHAQIKYKKSVWGVVKGFIEKNTWAGLEDFYSALIHALQSEYCIPPAKGRRPRKTTQQQKSVVGGISDKSATLNKTSSIKISAALSNKNETLMKPKMKSDSLSWFVIILLLALIVINVILYIKLWNLEEKSIRDFPDFSVLKNPPQTHEDWLKLLQQQESLHAKEMTKWQKVLESAVELLRKTENTLTDLQYLIQPKPGFFTNTEPTPSLNSAPSPLDNNLINHMNEI